MNSRCALSGRQPADIPVASWSHVTTVTALHRMTPSFRSSGETYVGIDLAADPRNTGIAVLREDGDSVLIEDVRVGAEDEPVIAAISSSRRAGIDVPFGWPRSFLDLLAGHRDGTMPAPADTGPDWRRRIMMRATDLEIRRRTGKNPLSVASDRIAYPAIRWAGIAARLREAGMPVLADGSGIACEAYPGGALAVWGLPHRSYKGAKNIAARRDLIAALTLTLPWLDWQEHRAACEADDNALDAVIAAVIARDVDQGRAVPPPPELAQLAAEEGWIWLPGGGA